MNERRESRRRHIGRMLALGIVVAASFSVGAAWWVGSELVAPAPSVVGAPPADLPMETVTIASASGSMLAGWFALPPPALEGIGGAPRAAGVVVLLHPIRGSRLSMLSRARMFHAAGYAVLLIDLQAHGESSGEHITIGHLERLDAAAAVDFARERCPGLPIIVDGASLGGAAALLASPLDIDALILEGVYPTIDEAVRNRIARRVPLVDGVVAEMLLVQLKPRLGIDRTQLRPIDCMTKIGCPVLVMIGKDDPLTTLAEAERMFDAALEPKELCVIDDAGHVDLCACGPERFREIVLSFLSRHVPATREAADH